CAGKWMEETSGWQIRHFIPPPSYQLSGQNGWFSPIHCPNFSGFPACRGAWHKPKSFIFTYSQYLRPAMRVSHRTLVYRSGDHEQGWQEDWTGSEVHRLYWAMSSSVVPNACINPVVPRRLWTWYQCTMNLPQRT